MWKDSWRATLQPSAKEHIHEANRPHGGAVLTSVLSLDISAHINPLEGFSNSPFRELFSLFLHMKWQDIQSTNQPVPVVFFFFSFMKVVFCGHILSKFGPGVRVWLHIKIQPAKVHTIKKNTFRAVWLFRILNPLQNCVWFFGLIDFCIVQSSVFSHTVTCFLQCHV